MTSSTDTSLPLIPTVLKTLPLTWLPYVLMALSGCLATLGFAPFHLPGLTLLCLASLFVCLLSCTSKQAFGLGMIFGMGYFGCGVSWVILSIHTYGELPYVVAGCITLLFIAYLALYPALMSSVFVWLRPKHPLLTIALFSSLWVCGEFLRSQVFTGFPWLLVGTTQMDTPLKHLAPLIGLSGLSFLCVFAAGLLAQAKRIPYLLAFIILMLSPQWLQKIQWTTLQQEPIRVGAIQANLSMRDKWDDQLFWHLLSHYKKSIHSLLGNQLIILPESAIPLPAHYLSAYLKQLDTSLVRANSALILGILQPKDNTETHYYNTMTTLGLGKGYHIKQHLVPFGEYIPKPFVRLSQWLEVPEANIVAPKKKQGLLRIAKHPVAGLICYEIAYPELLRKQLPKAQWIVSISDNGWFGHSLASYQQLQMAQMLSLMTGRFQVVVNNDGLSSIINSQGELKQSLPPFSAGILQGEIVRAVGATPWTRLGDYPVYLLCFIVVVISLRSRRPSLRA